MQFTIFAIGCVAAIWLKNPQLPGKFVRDLVGKLQLAAIGEINAIG